MPQKLKTHELVYWAYRKLKQAVYYDKTDLFLRKRLAEFEAGEDFEVRLNAVEKVVESLKSSNNPEVRAVNKWIEDISFKCLPKKVSRPDDESMSEEGALNNVLTNVRSFSWYKVESVNYLIDMPLELHILDVLWVITIGASLDKRISENCLGNRLMRNEAGEHQSKSANLFKIYHHQYAKWRDIAIEKAKNALENDTNVLLIGMDIKQCYYHIDPDWSEIIKLAKSHIEQGLCKILSLISKKYHLRTREFMAETHESAIEIQGLPIGLESSRVLCNWFLSRFDKDVEKKLQPLYYGRYVDDVIIVLQSPPLNTHKSPESTVKELFKEKELLQEVEKAGGKPEWRLECIPELHIQNDKLSSHFYDYKHSHAGLNKFMQEISKRASDFHFLPEETEISELEDCAYDLRYEGSINKLRSLVGLSENKTELSKFLSRRIIQYRLCGGKLGKSLITQLFRFFKGQNVLTFYDLWEKVFTLLVINGNDKDCAKFHNECQKVIEDAHWNSYGIENSQKPHCKDKITSLIQGAMEEYLNIALSMPLAFRPRGHMDKSRSRLLKAVIAKSELRSPISMISNDFRSSNMIRLEWVYYPLLSYTNFRGDLLNPKIPELENFYRKKYCFRYSPRHIHINELQLLAILKCLTGKDKLPENYCSYAEKWIKEIYGETNLPYQLAQHAQEKKGPLFKRLHVPDEEHEEIDPNLTVGIANMKVQEDDIKANYDPSRGPNQSFNRQAQLYGLLNKAIQADKCDLIVFPELSIPFFWMPAMVSFARKEQVGLVFGVEYFVNHKQAHNIVFTVLPYRTEGKFKGCYVSARLKNHYAPEEESNLNKYHINAVTPKVPYYEIFHWRGTSFSVFNCFELTNIAHRGIMQSALDFIVTVAWNKDIPYFDHILVSTSRDLHCYIVHANTSQFGDSRITAPKREQDMDYVRVKGGINPTLIKAKLDIKELRDFHEKKYDPDDTRFKPLPAGYDRNNH